MISITCLQSAVAVWIARNFPDRNPFAVVAGTAERRAEIERELGAAFIELCGVADLHEIDLEAAIADRWSTVREHPARGLGGGWAQSAVAVMLAEFHAAYRRSGVGDVGETKLRRGLQRDEGIELDDALVAGDPVAIARELADVVYVAYGTADARGIPLDAVIAEVHAANMRKFDGGAVMRPDGKLMKPPGWQPPDVAAVLREHGRPGDDAA